ncbi:MAG: FHA domain-containing protein [Candidatus Zixiibacteriota bacterium]
MTELPCLELAYFAGLALSSAAHVAGVELYESAKNRISKRLLQNHDIRKCLLESFGVTLRILKEQYLTTSPNQANWESARKALALLDSQGQNLFLSTSGDDVQMAAGIRFDDTAQLTDRLLSMCGSIPYEFAEFVRKGFPPAFIYAFRELGLKRNEKVRAIVTHEMLKGLEDSLKDVRARLDSLPEIVQKQNDAIQLQRELRTFAGEKFDRILVEIDKLRSDQGQMVHLLRGKPLQSGIEWGVLAVSNEDGYLLATHPLNAPDISLGRSPENSIPLPDAKVSQAHARILWTSDQIAIEDLGSKNGTTVNGRAILAKSCIRFGDEIRIGPFRLEIRSPENGPVQSLGFPTI